jgi:glycosyltransferase involved in cell wall biosynthesis
MRILHVIPTLDPYAGGPPMIAIRIAAAQGMAGHEVHFLSYEPDSGRRQRIAAESCRIPHFGDVIQHFLPPISFVERAVGLHARGISRRLVPGMDAIHLHGLWETIMLAAADEAQRCGIPYLILANGMLEPWAMRQGRLKKQFVMMTGWQRALRHAKAIQFGNPIEMERARPFIGDTPGVIIPNGVFLEEIDPLPPAGTFRATCPRLGDAPFILFLSRLHAQKGPDVLVSAFEILARENTAVHLALAGPDYGELRSLRTQIAASGLANRVHIIGPRYGRDKLAAMVDAACFCLPSRHEGFSLVVVEALAADTPVVISKECNFPEVATAGAGEVVELTPLAIAAALGRVLAADRIAMAGKARDLINPRYTWPHIAEQVTSAYGVGQR